MIRKRFTEQEIIQLLELQWWNWSQEEINLNMEILCSNNINELYKIYRQKMDCAPE